jgi:hypothetical protein
VSDPEILEPEIEPAPRGAGAQPTVGGDVIGIVERAFTGRIIRTEGVRTEVQGPAGTLEIIATPLIVVVRFRGVNRPLPAEPEAALALLRAIADGSIVFVEEHATAQLRRTHTVRVKDGALADIEDTTNDKHAMPSGQVLVVSFADGERDATKAERKHIAKAAGGLIGRLKRRVVETIVDKTMGAVQSAVTQAAENIENAARANVDDGRRRLGARDDD